jgi:hypothetical protein
MPQQSSSGVPLPALILNALSSAAPHIEHQRTLSRQQEETTRGLMQQRARQREADRRVQQQVSGIARSGPEADRTNSMAGFVQALRQSQARRGGSNPAVPGASDRFAAETGQAQAATGDYGRRMAGLLSRIDAPRYQRRGEGHEMARTGVDLGQISRFAQGDAFLSDLRRRRIQPNPWVALLSQLGQTVASNWPYEDGGDSTAHLMPGASASSTQLRLPVRGQRAA